MALKVAVQMDPIETVNIKGESYRLKEKRKAGLLGKPRPRTEPKEVAAT